LASTDAFKLARKAKETHTISSLCCKNAITMTKFAEEVFSYKFKETPNYEKLKKILIEAISPNHELDTSSSSVEASPHNNNLKVDNWSEVNHKMDVSDEHVASSIIPNKIAQTDISMIN
jgi:hypothetical protein